MEKLTSAQIERLKAPLSPEAIKPHPTKTYLSTIKAIYVVERFNEVFGLGGWFINNELIEAGEKNIVVKSTFQAPQYGIIIPDVFGGNDNADRGDAFKGACTDALTKIGSYLYVGMDVYKGLGEHKEQTVSSPIQVPTKKAKSVPKVDSAIKAIDTAMFVEDLTKITAYAKVCLLNKEITQSDCEFITKEAQKKEESLISAQVKK
jgi:hypothetical protein